MLLHIYYIIFLWLFSFHFIYFSLFFNSKLSFTVQSCKYEFSKICYGIMDLKYDDKNFVLKVFVIYNSQTKSIVHNSLSYVSFTIIYCKLQFSTLSLLNFLTKYSFFLSQSTFNFNTITHLFYSISYTMETTFLILISIYFLLIM